MTRATLWLCEMLGVSLLASIAIYRWQSALSSSKSFAPPPVALAVITPSTSSDALDDDLSALADADPFRLSNSPPTVRFDAHAVASATPGAALSPALVRPAFVLRAIVGGPPWQAIIDGIPGQQPGVIVHAGSAFDRISVTSVTRDSVILRGPDTTWALSFRRTP